GVPALLPAGAGLATAAETRLAPRDLPRGSLRRGGSGSPAKRGPLRRRAVRDPAHDHCVLSEIRRLVSADPGELVSLGARRPAPNGPVAPGSMAATMAERTGGWQGPGVNPSASGAAGCLRGGLERAAAQPACIQRRCRQHGAARWPDRIGVLWTSTQCEGHFSVWRLCPLAAADLCATRHWRRQGILESVLPQVAAGELGKSVAGDLRRRVRH